METLLEELQCSKPIAISGETFEYGSPCTQVLVVLTEAVSGEPWAGMVRRNIWSHMGADDPVQRHLKPDGIGLADVIVSSKLRGIQRFGPLFTPSRSRVSDKQVVRKLPLDRIRKGVRDKAIFMNGYDRPVFPDRLGDDRVMANARLWDCIWPDGDMYMGGFMDQGLYVSPVRELIIACFGAMPNKQMTRFPRPFATSVVLG